MIDGFYYLHENNSLIYKRNLGDTISDLRESSFVKGIWSIDTKNRENAWTICVEALAAGVNKNRILELAEKWGCNDKDAKIYAERINCILGIDGTQKTATKNNFINIQESISGFGNTYLEAMASLCRQLGYKPSKIWGTSFINLLNVLT